MVSFHPLVYPIACGILSAREYELVDYRAAVDPLAGAALDGIPPASVYVVEAHSRTSVTRAVLEKIAFCSPSSPVVMLAEAFDEARAFPLMQMRVRGMVTYRDAPAQLVRAVQAVAAGGFWISRTLLTGFLQASVAGDGRVVRPGIAADLTSREQQVLDAILANLSNKEIAKQLGITERGVKFHVSSLLEKHHVRRRSDLVLLFLTNG